MQLLQQNELGIGCADGGLEGLAIFQNIFALVPVGEAEIEDAFAGIEHAGSARSGAETVDQPWEFLEWREFKNLYAADAA
jgi:hypothetical protein